MVSENREVLLILLVSIMNRMQSNSYSLMRFKRSFKVMQSSDTLVERGKVRYTRAAQDLKRRVSIG